MRALLFDHQGKLVAKARVPIQSYFSTAPGWAEQQPEVFWEALCKSCHILWEMPTAQKDRIAGVALTTQRGTVINIDRSCKPLRPAVIWLDKRRTEGLKPIGGLWGLLFKVAGMSKTAAYLQAETEANWIANNQPEIWDKTYKYIYLSGYLTYLLTGRVADSIGCQVGYIPFDYKRMQWSKKFDWKWQAAPVRKDMLPELIQPSEMIGEISNQASMATGIPAGIPLIAAASDKACEVIGTGCLQSSIGCLSYGTAATINTLHHRYIEVIPLIPPYPAAVPGAYSLEVQIFRGFWMVSWFKQEFGHVESNIAKQRGIEPESLFDELVSSVPPGSDGLMLQPYWSPGLKVPGPEAKGAIIGFSDVHSRAHLYRSILEGLAYALREGAQRTEQRSRVPIRELRVAGGGSQSNAALQLTADIFGLPASRSHVYEASGLGAAIDAAIGVKLYPSFEAAISEMTHLGDTFEPDQTTHQIYDELFNRVYLKMYKYLQPFYEEINSILGVG